MITLGKRAEFDIATSTGIPETVKGYPLTGEATGLAMHKSRYGWVITHLESGMRMPDYFRTREIAREACATLLAVVPDALEIMGRIASRSTSTGDGQRLRDGWDAARAGGKTSAYAIIRAQIAEHFAGDFDDLASQTLEDIGATAEGWEYRDDCLYCPCGYAIEDDGRCPSGCVSPLVGVVA